MAQGVLISQEEYDHMVFEHDAEYVEGKIIERGMPTQAHGVMQLFLGHLLIMVARSLGFEAMSEVRIRTKPDRTRGISAANPLVEAPYLCN